ncbi:FMN-binding protein [Natranaerofaba carboxydovora]|uniref:FMN-binding protein n=1 Tax=Natranaerofaba carboxydovora TaxID=2742683 RepID=UPI001F1339DB|nr:FMN-binding protein [Natranaerofaba carboxydovora]UMZ74688.1 FMN-binding domain protein [Natranaerofaba carboxydovora]
MIITSKNILTRKKLILAGLIIFLLAILVVGCEDEGTKADETGLGDETYQAVSDVESCGYLKAEVTIEDQEIVEVDLTEFDNKGRLKTEDYEYPEWKEAMDVLPERFVEANSSEVEIVSSATRTSNRAMQAVDRALQLSKGEEKPFDGIYMGVAEISEDGWGIALVRLEDEQITQVILEEIDEEKNFKEEEDYPYDEWQKAREELRSRFVENDSYEVDIYSGATKSSEKWKAAVKDALTKAGRE